MIQKVCVILVVLLAVGSANAYVAFYDGFETQPLGSGFTEATGDAAAPIGHWYNGWQKGTDTGELVIVTAPAEGTQSLQINRDYGGKGQFPALIAASLPGVVANGAQLKFSWDVWIDSAATAGAQVPVYLGAPYGALWYITNDSAGHLNTSNNGVATDTGFAFPTQTWATFEMDVLVQDISSTQRKGIYDAFVTVGNVKTQVAAGFAFSRQVIWSGDDGTTARFQFYGNPAVSTWNVDNATVESSIPEPATISLLGLGLATLLRKRS